MEISRDEYPESESALINTEANTIQLIQCIGISRALLIINTKPEGAQWWRDMDCVVTPYEHLYYRQNPITNRLQVYDDYDKIWNDSVANKKGAEYIVNGLVDISLFEQMFISLYGEDKLQQ